MKSYNFIFIFFSFMFSLEAQTVQGSICASTTNENQFIIYTKPNSSISAEFSTIQFAISIPTQTTTPILEIKTNNVPNIEWDILPVFDNLGRSYYTVVGNDNDNSTQTSWSAGVDNEILVLEFGAGDNGAYEIIQLNDLSPSGGSNFQAYWYVEQIGGSGDITNYSQMFYETASCSNSLTNSGGISPSSVQTITTISLPISLSTFTAVSNQRNTDLRWTTSSETNASHFGVQRSRDGYNWENVVKVTAVGESNTLQEYDYVDINAIDEVNDEGHLYYRLVLTDLDGSYEYSDMQKVKFDTSSTTIFSVYPNPTIQRVSLDMKGYIIDQNTSVSLFDASGRLVLQNAIENTNYEIDLKSAGLSAGVYTIMLMQGNKVVAQRLIALL